MVAKVNTTQEWKNYTSSKSGYRDYGDKHEEKLYSDSELKDLFNVTLSAIQKTTEIKLSRPIEVFVIMNLNVMIGDLNNLLDVAIEILPGMKDGSQLRHYLHSMRLAYRLNTAEALGYPAGTDINQESNLLLHFGYQDSCLEVSMTDGGTITSLVEQRFEIPDFGGVGQIASLEKLEHLASRLKYFIRIPLSDSQPPALTEFRSIVFSGNATASEFQKICEIIIKVILEFADRFSEGINPAWVSAVGAARRAREYMLNPQNWDHGFQDQVYEDLS
ncbi:hypothetical protein BPOR_0059g00140 [Botrytis porri]|uniref:Uncharacterized protein n=1 Tax=Botrytis porri TaxID=87229 RepID=A0A4Z1L1C8_9HELO|nr:hypothetical protein BPOR_0059g00140 [Botrytis porri]